MGSISGQIGALDAPTCPLICLYRNTLSRRKLI
jgi:hypothetical protein